MTGDDGDAAEAEVGAGHAGVDFDGFVQRAFGCAEAALRAFAGGEDDIGLGAVRIGGKGAACALFPDGGGLFVFEGGAGAGDPLQRDGGFGPAREHAVAFGAGGSDVESTEQGPGELVTEVEPVGVGGGEIGGGAGGGENAEGELPLAAGAFVIAGDD